MPTTHWRYTSCHNCKFCLSAPGARAHGPHPEHWVSIGGGRQVHRYGAAGGDGFGSGGLAPPPDFDSSPVSEAITTFITLPPERQEEIEEVLRARSRVGTVRAAVRRDARAGVEAFFGREGRLPTDEELSEIEESAAEGRKRELKRAVRDDEKKSKKLNRWRDRERKQREKDRESYESDRARYEEQQLKQMENFERKRLHSVVSELGGFRTNDALREEYRAVPNTYLRRDGMSGDDMASHLAELYPEFGIYSERDLIDFFSGAAA